MPIARIEQTDAPDARDSGSPDIPGDAGLDAESLDESVRLKNSLLPSRTVSTPDGLPSMGLAYPPGWSVTFRAYVFGEVEKIDSGILSRRDMYALVLSGMETSFPKEDLTYQDFWYLGLRRRLLTMQSNDVWFVTSCPLCRSENRTKYRTVDFSYDDLEVEALPVSVQLDGRDVSFMPMTIGRRMSLGETVDVNEWMAHCANLADPSREVEEYAGFLGGLSHPDDVYLLRKVDTLMHHGARPFRVTCAGKIKGEDEEQVECGYPYLVDATSLVDVFILPFRFEESTPGLEDKIRFGV